MQIFRSLEDIAAARAATRAGQQSVVTIGSFDGIHLAHRELLRRVCKMARGLGAASVAVSFDPHPLAVLAPDRMPKLITPLDARLDLLAATGIDRLLLIPFTTELSRWTPERFVERVLVEALNTRAVIVGDNFRFGYAQAGTPELLAALGPRHSFSTEIFPKMTMRGRTVSSSEIRALLEQGRLSLANRLLGRPFSVRGPIEGGLGLGRAQTVPTFNLGSYSGLLPARGVYVTATRLGKHSAPFSPPLESVTNVGTRPTFGERELGVETHLLDPPRESNAGSHPDAMEISFLYRLRDEIKFDSPKSLQKQIHADIVRARTYFRRAPGLFSLGR